jgi:hypothetical protein
MLISIVALVCYDSHGMPHSRIRRSARVRQLRLTCHTLRIYISETITREFIDMQKLPSVKLGLIELPALIELHTASNAVQAKTWQKIRFTMNEIGP